MKKVLVTGADGLLGNALRHVPGRENFDFIYASRKDADLEVAAQAEALVAQHRPDCILHTAAVVGGIRYNVEKPEELRDRNQRINRHLLDAAVKHRVGKTISFLSTCIFSEASPEPWDETMVQDGKPDPRQWGYAQAKRELDVMSREYTARTGGVNRFVTLMPSTLFGPNENFDPERSHVLPATILKIFRAREDGKPATFWGSGEPRREFLYSMDMAQIVLWAIENYEDSQPLIVAPRFDLSVKEVVDAVSEILNFKNKIEWDLEKQDGKLTRRTNTGKFRKLFPDFQFTPFKSGLEVTIQFFLKNYPRLRGVAPTH